MKLNKKAIKNHLAKNWFFGDGDAEGFVHRISSEAIMLFLEQTHFYVKLTRDGSIEVALMDNSIIYKTRKIKMQGLVEEYIEVNTGEDYSAERAVSDVYKILVNEGVIK